MKSEQHHDADRATGIGWRSRSSRTDEQKLTGVIDYSDQERRSPKRVAPFLIKPGAGLAGRKLTGVTAVHDRIDMPR